MNGRLVVRDFAELSFTKDVNAADVMVLTELFGEKIAEGEDICHLRQVSALRKTLLSRYARDMVLRSMFGGIAKRNMVNNKHSSEKTNDGSKVRVASLTSKTFQAT